MTMRKPALHIAAGIVLGLLAACANKPAQPEWQMNAADALQRSLHAYLAGDARIEAQEFAKARSELTRTGRADLVARAELARCASRVASLVLEGCPGFDALQPDAALPEQAYEEYLAASVGTANVAALPEQHRATAAALAAGRADAAVVQAIADPLARLVAAGVVFRAGQSSPALIASAVTTASAQGWRRPLLAWLNVQADVARQGGDTATEATARRRIALVQGPEPGSAPVPSVRP